MSAEGKEPHRIATQRQMLAIGRIGTDPSNRAIAEDEDFTALVDSIRVLGVLQPLHVRAAESGHYQLIDGERRWRAAKVVGLSELPCEVWPSQANPRDALVAGVVLNDQRKAHSSIHVARRLREIKNAYGLTIEEVANRTGMPADRVKSYLGLLAGASDFLIGFFEKSHVPLKVAVEIVRYEKATSEARAKKLVARHVDSPLTKDQIAALRKKGIEAPTAVEQPKTRCTLARRIEMAMTRDHEGAFAEVEAALAKFGYLVTRNPSEASGASGSELAAPRRLQVAG